MSNLSDISIDKIETDVMSVLYANMDKKFTQYTLFNKLLESKYKSMYTNFIHQNFKSKFLLVIRTLGTKYDDIEISKKEEIYFIVCKSDKYKQSIIHENENENENETKQSIQTPKDLFLEHFTENFLTLTKSDVSNMYDYIYNNDLKEYIDFVEPCDGNTIYHELILNNNLAQTLKLINDDNFYFHITNKNNQTPIDLINSLEMSNLIIKHFIKKILLITEKYNIEKSNVSMLTNKLNCEMSYHVSDEYRNVIINNTTFLDFFLAKTKIYHLKTKMYLTVFLVFYLLIKFIF